MENLTVKQLADKISKGDLTSRQVTEDMLTRIGSVDGKIGAYITVFNEESLEAAEAVDKKIADGKSVGLLAGVPVAVKDNMCTAFGPTTCASKILDNFYAPYNAHVIERLRQEDAVIIGKTNLDEFAMGSSTENSGLKKTVNPWDFSRVPGGSSGGSAAAVAAGLCYAALGSDTGGSIRQPAGFCSVTGLKPTYGRVSRYGLVAFGSSLDQIGPLTADAADAALIMNVIAGKDERDSTSVPEDTAPVSDYLGELEKPIENLKIGIIPEFIEGAQDEISEAVQNAVRAYSDMGAEIIEIEMPNFEYAIATYYVVATAEASSNLARYDGVHYGYRTPDPNGYIDVYSKSRAEAFGPEVKRRIMLGTYALSSGYYDAYYLKALKVRNLIRGDFNRAFENVDCIMMPVTPTTAFKLGEKLDDPLAMYMADIYTLAISLAGVPAASIPCGFDGGNMPIGLQIITPAFTEGRLLNIAAKFQNETDWHRRKPELEL